MSSELLKFVIENSASFRALDFVFLFSIAGSVVASAVGVVHWIYKHAFETQGEVIRSQDRLIALKDSAIAEYEHSIKKLAEDSTRSEQQMAVVSKELDRLNERSKTLENESRIKQQDLMAYSLNCLIATLVARTLFAFVGMCHQMRFLVKVYGAIRNQHNDRTGMPVGVLLAKIDEIQQYTLTQAEIFRLIKSPSEKGFDLPAIPKAIVEFDQNHESEKKVEELISFVHANCLPTIQKYEPSFASRIARA